jgi:hypothetical protein
MQFTLLAVFLVTLGLAAMLSQSRAKALSVELTDKPFLNGPIALRYPKGWEVRQESDEAPVRVIEPNRGTGGEPRVLVLHQLTVPRGTSAEQLFQRLFQDDWRDDVRPIEFPMLDQPGVAARLDHYEQASAFEIHVIPRWCAATVVPGAGNGGQDLGVILEIRGPGVTGPAGPRLTRQLADGLSLRQKRER